MEKQKVDWFIEHKSKHIYDAIVTATNGVLKERLIFIVGPGDSGNSWLHNVVIGWT